MKLKNRKIKYAALFCLCWFVFLVFLVDGVLKFQTLVDYFGSYALVEITLLLLVILPTLAVYILTKEDKTMSKRDYIQANKNWLEAKSKEEGVKALPKGIYYKVLAEGDASSAQPTVRSIITAHYTGKTIDGKQFDSSRGGVPLAVGSVTSLRAGSLLCSRCISVTSGKSISLQRWVMASFLSLAFLEVLRLSLKLNC